jgi:O-antigen/teichoic acid export membrane protein
MPQEGKSQDSVFTLEKSIEGSVLNYSFLGISKVSVHLLHLAALAIITRRLGSELFGQLSLFLMMTQFLYLVTTSWTGVGYTRYAILQDTAGGPVSEVFWTRSLLIMGFIAIAGAVIVLEKSRLLGYLTLPPPALLLIFLHFFSLVITDYTRQVAQVATEFRRLAIVQLMEKGALLFLLWLWGRSLFAIIVLYSITAVGFEGYFLLSLNRVMCRPLRVSLGLCWKLITFSYPLILTSIGGFIFGWIDIAIIKHFFPFSEVGVYSLAYSGLGTLESVVLLMPTVLTPIFVSLAARERHELTERFLQRVLPQVAMLWGLIIMVLVLVSPWLIPIVFGEAFSRSAPVFLLLLIPLHLSVLNGLSMSIFVGYEMVQRMVLINFSASIINLLLDLVFVPRLGVMGAAAATSLSYCFICVFYFGLLKARFDFVVSRMLLFIGIIAIEVGGMLAFPSTSIRLVVALSAAGIYILASTSLGTFSRQDKSIYASLEMPGFLKKAFIAICDYCG